MLFYNQIKREFTQASWKRGQAYFRDERVKDVRLAGKDGNLVVAKVQGSDKAAYETAIVMARGTIFNSDCSCPAHRLYESHCKHVAALSIWVLERGSLLRAGVADSNVGVAEAEPGAYRVFSNLDKAMTDARIRMLLMTNPHLKTCRFILRVDKAAGLILGEDPNHRPFSIPVNLVEAVALQENTVPQSETAARPKPIRGEPVLFVRGVFGAFAAPSVARNSQKVLQAISLDPAVRYFDPHTHIEQVEAVSHLVRQPEALTWRTGGGVYLKLPHEVVPVLQTLDAAKVVYQGVSALENLAKLLTSDYRDHIVFHPSVRMEVEDRPLKLVSLNIGERTALGRELSYEFKGGGVSLSSSDLAEAAAAGKLSSQYLWKDNKLFRFEVGLSALSRYASRSGIAQGEGGAPKAAFSTEGMSQLEDDAEHPLHPLAAYRLSLELGVTNFNVDPEWKEFHEWRKIFERRKTPPLPGVEYGFELRDYQANGLTWLWSLYHRGLAALLADDMGLGKTHQVLAFLSSLYRRRGAPTRGASSLRLPGDPALVIAPTSVVSAWVQKLQKYETGLRWHVFHGKGRRLPTKDADLVLTTYGILQKEPALRSRSWHVIVLDEAQAIKNSATISARASRELKSRFRVAMTGTPVENQSTDLWSIMEVLLPGYLGSLPRFKRIYGAGREAPSEYQAAALRRLVSPFLLRRTKAQVLTELPEKTEEVLPCELTAAQRKAYRMYLASAEADRVRENLQGVGKIDYASILALLTRLKQVCDHPRLADLTSGRVKRASALDPLDSGKWETIEELIHEALGSNLKVVVFTQYLGMMDLIQHWLKQQGVGYTELRGDTPDRTARLKEFAENPECKVFVCSLLAGGLGIDLTSASVCIHVDRWWNPARENQATDRLHRIGQTRGVQVFKLKIPGTIEDRIASIIESKIALSGALIEESPAGLKAFSRKELLELLTAPPDTD